MKILTCQVYQSSRGFTIGETLQIKEVLQTFTKTWKNCGIPVKGYANLFFEHFIVLIADESSGSTGDFSTDTIITLIRNIEKDFQVELLNRLMLAIIIQERIQLLPLTQINPSIEKDFITNGTLHFNNTILTKKELMNNWIVPVNDSWLAIRVPAENRVEIEY